jgi:hypothetical protein
MNTSLSFFEMFTLLCAFAWRHQEAVPEETSVLEPLAQPPASFQERSTLGDGRNAPARRRKQ